MTEVAGRNPASPAQEPTEGAADSRPLPHLVPRSPLRADRSDPSQPGPRVSIVVAVYNGEATIQRCIDSIMSQEDCPVELVVQDGASRDGTADIVKRNGPSIILDSGPDSGVFDAWNKALARVRGEWICFLGADDYLWNAHVLSDMAPHLERAHADGVRVVYGKVASVSKDGAVRRLMGRPWAEVRERLLWEMCIPHPGMFHHRSLFDRHGLFDDSYRVAGDYEFLMRELKDGEARFVPDVITVGFQEGGMSNRPEFALTALREMGRVRRRYNLRAPLASRISATYLKIHASIWLSRALGHGGAHRAKGWYRRVRALLR